MFGGLEAAGMEPNEAETDLGNRNGHRKRASGEQTEVARVLLYKWLAAVRLQSACFGPLRGA